VSDSVPITVQTVRLSDILTNGKAYEVPLFQSDYSWTAEELGDLWEDLSGLHRGGSGRHFMGSIVLQRVSETTYRLIDGQQRLATLSILALAVVRKLENLAAGGIDADANRERARLLRRTFVGERTARSLTYSSRLVLNQQDNSFYQDYLVQARKPPNPMALPDSNRLLWEAQLYLEGRLGELFGADASGADLAGFLDETVAPRLIFIQVQVNDDLNAYTLFETLNARGISLGPGDLVKNYLYSLTSGSGPDLSFVDNTWQRILAAAGQKEIPDFLRCHLGSLYPRVRRERLLHTIQQRVPSREAVIDFLNEVEIDAELYSALNDPAHDYWRESPEARRYVRMLSLTNAAPLYPVLLAAHRRFDFDEFLRLLKLAYVTGFRLSVAGRPSAEIEPFFNRAAKEIRKGAASKPRQVFELFREAYVDDDRFESALATLSLPAAGKSRARLRHILYEIENYRSSRSLDPGVDPGTIEHVLPENPAAEWFRSFTAGHASRLVQRLGNMTILEPRLNRDLGSAPYETKRETYARSGYVLTREIVSEEWSPSAIQARQRQLAETAVRIWRADFD